MEKKISNTTINNYNNYLNTLKSMNIDIDNVTLETLKTISILKSGAQYLSAIKWKLKINNQLTDELEKAIKININDASKENKIKLLKSEASDKQISKYISWKKILEIREFIKNQLNNKKDKETELNYLILSLYIEQPVRRIRDYSEMYINDDITIPTNGNNILFTEREDQEKYKKYEYEKCNEDTSNYENEKNYYIRKNNKSYFLFNYYKTVKKFNKQYVSTCNNLKNIIDLYILNNKLTNGDKLINLDNNTLSARVIKIFKKYCNKSIDVDMMRHIFICYLYSSKRFLESPMYEKLYYGYLMCHSKIMQENYKLIIKNSKEDIIAIEQLSDGYEDLKLDNNEKIKYIIENNDTVIIKDYHPNWLVQKNKICKDATSFKGKNLTEEEKRQKKNERKRLSYFIKKNNIQ